MPLLTDADIIRDNLDPDLFPGISDNIKVHNGFSEAHAECVSYHMCQNLCLSGPARTAQDVLSAVKKTMQDHTTNKVTVVGHSLGRLA